MHTNLSDSLKELTIKLVIWDLDETLWKGTLAEGEEPVLYQNRAELVKTLNRRGIINSICSKNDFHKAQDVLIKMNLWDQFVFPKISFLPKGEVIKELLQEIGLQAKHTLFIDDNDMNLNEVKYYNPDINVLNAKNCDEIPINDWGKSDEKLSRLNQYKILENKIKSRSKNMSNDEFLRSSNIKVQFIDFENEFFDRLYELIERTNQLNFTKIRSNKYELRAIVNDTEIKTQLIRVEDNFGDYGIIGFYSLKNNELIHFVFSCRIMNMGIEQFVYEQLNYPKLNIVGDVASLVHKNKSKIDYIKLIAEDTKIHEANETELIEQVLSAESKVNIFGIGACDLYHVIGYFNRPNQYLVYECNTFIGKARGVNVGTEYIRSQIEMNEEEKSFCKAHFFNYKRHNVFKSQIYDDKWDYVVMSFQDDMIYKICEYKDNPNLRVVFNDGIKFSIGQTPIININGKIEASFLEQCQWLADNFKKPHYISKERFISNVEFIMERLPEKTKLILVTGPELEFFRVSCPSAKELREQIILINQAIRFLVDKYPNKCAVVDMNDVVKSTDDITDYIFHLKANTAYNLFIQIIDTIINNFPTQKPSMLKNVLRGRKLCLFGKGNLEILNAYYNLRLGNCEPTEFIYHDKVNNAKFKINDWEQYIDKANEFFIVVADSENYSTIRKLLIEGHYEPLKDFVQLKDAIKTSYKSKLLEEMN